MAVNMLGVASASPVQRECEVVWVVKAVKSNTRSVLSLGRRFGGVNPVHLWVISETLRPLDATLSIQPLRSHAVHHDGVPAHIRSIRSTETGKKPFLHSE